MTGLNYFLPALGLAFLSSFSSYGSIAQDSSSGKAAKAAVGVQVREHSAFEFVRYKWDVSIDATFILPAFYSVTNVSTFGPPATTSYANVASPIYYGYTTGASSFDASQARSARFLVRKNETVFNRTNIPQRRGAYRFSATIGGGKEAVRTDTVYFPGTNGLLLNTGTSAFNIGASIGYEWQHQLGRFQGYYGYDLLARYSYYSQTIRVVNSTAGSTSSPVDVTDHSFFMSAAVLVGVKYFVHSRFSLGLEGTYTATGYLKSYDSLLPADFSKQRYHADGFYFNLVPISAFNATFHFGNHL